MMLVDNPVFLSDVGYKGYSKCPFMIYVDDDDIYYTRLMGEFDLVKLGNLTQCDAYFRQFVDFDL